MPDFLTPPRVLILTSVYPRHEADPEVPWMRKLLGTAREQGARIHVLAPSWKGLADHEIEGIPVFRFRYATRDLEMLTGEEGAANKMARKPWLQLLAIPYILAGAWRTFRLARRHRYDAIHANWPFPHALLALPACWILRIPLVTQFYGAELLLRRKKPWVVPFLRLAIRASRKVVAISNYTAGQVREIHPCDPEIIPYGAASVPAGLLQESEGSVGESGAAVSPGTSPVSRVALETSAASTTGFPASPVPASATEPPVPGSAASTAGASASSLPPVILFVGRHVERKGIPHLIDAMSHLRQDPSTELWIVGDGDQTPALKIHAAGSPARDRIRFLGRISAEELDRSYRRATLLAFPSIVDSRGDTEGLGVVALEAYCYLKPVVASNVGGIPDVVVDGQTGLLVAPGDPEALAQAIDRLIGDPALSARLARQGLSFVRDYFDWQRIAGRLIEIWKDPAPPPRPSVALPTR